MPRKKVVKKGRPPKKTEFKDERYAKIKKLIAEITEIEEFCEKEDFKVKGSLGPKGLYFTTFFKEEK